MNAARKGRRLEHRTKARLATDCRERHPDALVELRAAASKGDLDLAVLCVECATVVGVQVKANRWPGRAEMGRLDWLATKASGKPWTVRMASWRWNDGDRAPQVRVHGQGGGSCDSTAR